MVKDVPSGASYPDAVVIGVGEQPEEADHVVNVIRRGKVQHITQKGDGLLVVWSAEDNVANTLNLRDGCGIGYFDILRPRPIEFESGTHMWL